MKQEWGGELLATAPFLYGSNNVFKKEVLFEVGKYNERYKKNYEDVDISQRIKEKGYTLVYQPKAVVSHVKEDTVSSLFDAFWNWNFTYHEQRGYYNDTTHLCRKLKENVGLANRFLEEDAKKRQLPLASLDFLLAFSLCLKDFNFHFYRDGDMQYTQDLLTLYLQLIDLTFFYHWDALSPTLRTFIPHRVRYSQNYFVLLLLVGRILLERISNQEVIKGILRYCLTLFISGEEMSLEFFLDKLLVLLVHHHEWGGFLEKEHAHLEKKLIRSFIETFRQWVDMLVYHYPEVFEPIGQMQNILIKKEGC